jgi:hypothetical protein
MKKYFDLPTLCTGIALLFLVSIFLSLASRSVWVDEARLLKNIIEVNTLSGFITPLPYYDQAEPVPASFFFKAVMAIFHYDIKPLRLSVLAASVLMILPVCLLYKKYKWGLFVFLVAIIGNTFSSGFHVTELKYYFLEVSGSFLAIFAIWEAEENKQIFWTLLIAAIISLIGFSTLIVSGGLLGYAFLWCLANRELPRRNATIVAFLCAAACVAFSYLYMKHLTIYQMSNYAEYGAGKSLLVSMKSLDGAILGAYGKALLITSCLSSIALFAFNNRGFIFRLNVFFCALVCVVVAGRIFGFYPATYPRHVIWLVPFSLVISSCAILEFTSSRTKTFNVLGWILFVVLALQAGKACYKNFTGENYEYTANNSLYEYMAKMEPSNVLVYPNAQPSLEYYLRLDDRLKKHHYTSVVDETTHTRDPAMEMPTLFSMIRTLFKLRPAGEFYLLLSHLDRQNDDKGITAVIETEINKFDCQYTSVLHVHNAELLRMHCRVDHE